MTDTQKQSSAPDWSQMAKDALDIWQTHLTSLATDPKAKEEMARFVTPMTEAMSGWSSVMQQGMQQMMQMATQAAEQTQAAYDAAQNAAEAATQTGATSEAAPPEESPHEDSPPQTARAPEQQDVTEEPAFHEQSVPVSDAPASGPVDEPDVEPRVQPVVTTEIRPEPVGGPEPAGQFGQSSPAPESGRAPSADGSRSLAELAGRLALLERELDQLRPRARRKDAAEPVADGSDERVAGPDKGTDIP